MTFINIQKILVLITTVILTGCAPMLTNMEVTDLKKTDNLRMEWTVNKSIAEIKTHIQNYNFKCLPVVEPQIDPSNKNFARAKYLMPGLTNSSTVGLLEFTQINQSLKQTSVKAWYYFPLWTKFGRHYKKVLMLNDASLCIEL